MSNMEEVKKAIEGELAAIVNQIECLDVNLEICGNWLWISGNTSVYENLLRGLGCVFSAKKEMWYFRPHSLPEVQKTPRETSCSIEEIRGFHGSVALKKAQYQQTNTPPKRAYQTHTFQQQSRANSTAGFPSRIKQFLMRAL